ncbi:MAG: hypothetical protein LBU95_01715, partial [Rikenellaceae bacterium]|nr:hypothetical protein [Rikenellaceae bacterium]
MKNLSIKLLIAAVAGLLSFWSCNTEEVEPNVPQISVQEGNLVYVDALEGEFTLHVNTNRDWRVSIPDGVEWLIVDPSQLSGTGNAAVVFYHGSNTDITHEVTVRISTATTWYDVRVVQRGATPSTVLLYENMGNTNVGGNTNISDLPETFKWLRDGMGASDVTYAGTNSSLRTTYSSADLYLGASGGNNCFFGSGANFTVSGIQILDNPVVKVTFGCSKSGSDYGYVPIAQSDLLVQYSFDGGTTWNDADFTRTNYNGWGIATVDDIVVTGGATKIDLRFAAQVASVIRLDDVTVTGIGGDEITTPVVTTYASTANTPNSADV